MTHVQRVMMALSVLMMMACFAGDDEDNNQDDGPISCSVAVNNEGEAFIALDRSCTQASDCAIIEIGTCGCMMPVNEGAEITDYAERRSQVISSCGENISQCDKLTCQYNVDASSVTCNAQGMCDGPKTEE